MKKVFVALLGSALVGLGVAADTTATRPTPSITSPRATMSVQAQTELVKTYCVTCHNDKAKMGGLTLQGFDLAHPEKAPQTAEKMIRKLTAGMMPPPDVKRPDEAVLAAFLGALESRMDAAAAADPNPGWRPFQRLNRAEYTRAVKDLLDLDVDVSSFLPADTISHGFDNVADVQTFSATLLDGYLRAATHISRLAAGDPHASPTSVTFNVPQNESQMRHVPGTPFGTRGGLAVVHIFPADGTYVFKPLLTRTVSGELFGNTGLAIDRREEELEISINGDRVALVRVSPRMSDADPQGFRLETPPIDVKAGPQRVAAAFLQRFNGPVDDLMAPIEYTLVDTRIGTGFGITAVPHLQDLMIGGPFDVTGVSETPSRRRIFSCRPTATSEERECATSIVTRLARQAYRGPLDDEDLADLMRFYDQERKQGDFESGIRLAVQGILANPRFLFRLEQGSAALRAARSYRVSDIELASRLSFFLWGTVPDAELVDLAIAGRLSAPGVLEKQVRRMLADARSEALATRFGAQWLHLQDAEKIRPDGLLYPYWDKYLTQALQRETELFFDSLVREDRGLLELLTADYTFANERVARHYGIPNVTGEEFRRVPLPESRRGILGHGSILMLTSVADRTSPVQRGKWVMQVLLGTPPPPPPPNVPALEDTRAAAGQRVLSVRERMEEHRKNPACNSCHRVIDPLGLALENYDVTGRWRIKDNGAPVDAAGELYDGSAIEGPEGLRNALLKRRRLFVLSFTESLMTYALGRRVEHFDMPTVRAIVRAAENNNYRMSSLILGVINSPAFRMSRPNLAETTEAPGQP